jgi:regulator of sirC expression with transglutaminase-like and TPR domain
MNSARVLVHPLAARQRFRELAQLPEASLGLTEGALVIALEEYPALQVHDYIDRIESWTSAIRERLEGATQIERVIDTINHFLFQKEGFHGESDDYYDLRCAFLNEVLDRHAGLPISLSIVYLEISRRLGLNSHGVALPGRFLVKVSGDFGELLIDPYDEGRVLSTVECQRILDGIFGGGVRLREHHLRSFGNREILARMLSHLKGVYLARHDLERAAATIDRVLMLDDRDQFEVRDRANIALQMHRYEDAVEFLERYLALAPHAQDVPSLREEIAYLRAWLEGN